MCVFNRAGHGVDGGMLRVTVASENQRRMAKLPASKRASPLPSALDVATLQQARTQQRAGGQQACLARRQVRPT
jgi:hypothetical protein